GRGWGGYGHLSKPIDKHAAAHLALVPGVYSFARAPEDQTVGNLTIAGRTFSALPAIGRAEILRDVELLCRSATVTSS
ncbi:MAG TPA: hypothetical protein VGH87_24260, partial [Polyangiaceae bacterium]